MAGNTYKNDTGTKKKKSSKVSKPKINLSFDFLKDPRLHLATGLFLIITSVCFLFAFTSYLFSGLEDQEVYQKIGQLSIKEVGDQAHNVLGTFGVWLSYVLVYKWFGVGSYVLVPILGILGYKVLTKKEVKFFGGLVKLSLFALFWSSVVLGYISVAWPNSRLVYYCGGVGYEIAYILNSATRWGTGLILLFFLAVFVIYFFNITSLGGIQIPIGKRRSEEADDEDEIIESDGPFVKTEDAGILVEPVSGEEIKEEIPVEDEMVLRDEPTVVDETAVVDAGTELELEELKPKPPIEKKDDGLKLDLANDLPSEADLPLPTEEVESTENLGLDVEEAVKEKTAADVENMENYDPTLDLPSYQYPPISLLTDYSTSKVSVTREELEQNKDRIVDTLGNYKIGISSIKATIGPTVTLYEIVPEAGVKISKIKNLEDDIALSLAALGIRIIAPIPGKGTIGIEVPNKNRETVSCHSVFSTEKFLKSDKSLPVAIGKTISNEVFVLDLAKMPHLLMAGATGQGKSVGINMILASLLYKKHPSQLKFVLVDPKKVELSIFNKIERHFLAMLPDGEEAIITDTKKVVNTLNSLCIEMDARYDLLKDAGCRNLKEYNKKFVERKLNPLNGHRYMPFIVLVIDELADLMMTAGKEVETPIARLAQLARAIGIHLVVATQRPSVNVITGIIKANFPARVSFKVTSKIDSRTILDAGGADQLVGMGDMLFSQGSDVIRLQCAFIDTPEVDAIVDWIGEQKGYDSAYQLPEYVDENAEQSDVDLSDRDSMFDEAARTIVKHQQGSTSLLQRKLKLGYNRAGRIVDQLEAAGIVGPFEGSKAREVYVKDEYALEQLLNELKEI